MEQLRFLLDENVHPGLRGALQRRAPDMSVWVVGDPGAPLRGTLDPEILAWCETHHFALVTNNRSSMPLHLHDHLARGQHISGIPLLDPDATLGEAASDLTLIWSIGEPEDYQDRLTYLREI